LQIIKGDYVPLNDFAATDIERVKRLGALASASYLAKIFAMSSGESARIVPNRKKLPQTSAR